MTTKTKIIYNFKVYFVVFLLHEFGHFFAYLLFGIPIVALAVPHSLISFTSNSSFLVGYDFQFFVGLGLVRNLAKTVWEEFFIRVFFPFLFSSIYIKNKSKYWFIPVLFLLRTDIYRFLLLVSL